MKPLKMGNIEAKVPVIQGGMGIGISLGGLAGAVALEGGIGIISAAQIGFREPDFDSDTKEYYLDSSMLNAGDNLYLQEGEEVYTVSRRATLIGVYNMNKGYADFKQISILYQNDEYAIVKPNTKYGLSVYDYIVLNADSVRDDQFINQK